MWEGNESCVYIYHWWDVQWSNFSKGNHFRAYALFNFESFTSVFTLKFYFGSLTSGNNYECMQRVIYTVHLDPISLKDSKNVGSILNVWSEELANILWCISTAECPSTI